MEVKLQVIFTNRCRDEIVYVQMRIEKKDRKEKKKRCNKRGRPGCFADVLILLVQANFYTIYTLGGGRGVAKGTQELGSKGKQ